MCVWSFFFFKEKRNKVNERKITNKFLSGCNSKRGAEWRFRKHLLFNDSIPLRRLSHNLEMDIIFIEVVVVVVVVIIIIIGVGVVVGFVLCVRLSLKPSWDWLVNVLQCHWQTCLGRVKEEVWAHLPENLTQTLEYKWLRWKAFRNDVAIIELKKSLKCVCVGV